MKRLKTLAFAFMLALVGCSSVRQEMADFEATRLKENESKAAIIERALSPSFTGRQLWLKPPKLNDCEYDSSRFPTFSQVEAANLTASVAHNGAYPPFRISIQLRRKTVEGQLTFIFFERGTDDIPPDERCFYHFDPKKKYKMSASDWALIGNSSYRIGFSPAQLQLSIGAPENINRTVAQGLVHEQWVYDNQVFKGYIYFENGKLSSWQD